METRRFFLPLPALWRFAGRTGSLLPSTPPGPGPSPSLPIRSHYRTSCRGAPTGREGGPEPSPWRRSRPAWTSGHSGHPVNRCSLHLRAPKSTHGPGSSVMGRRGNCCLRNRDDRLRNVRSPCAGTVTLVNAAAADTDILQAMLKGGGASVHGVTADNAQAFWPPASVRDKYDLWS